MKKGRLLRELDLMRVAALRLALGWAPQMPPSVSNGWSPTKGQLVCFLIVHRWTKPQLQAALMNRCCALLMVAAGVPDFDRSDRSCDRRLEWLADARKDGISSFPQSTGAWCHPEMPSLSEPPQLHNDKPNHSMRSKEIKLRIVGDSQARKIYEAI
eukprot:SAG31_NODE_17602_length_665_cov_0.547703_2_plen_155_part_01